MEYVKTLFYNVFRIYGLKSLGIKSASRQATSLNWKARQSALELRQYLCTYCSQEQHLWNDFFRWAEYAQINLIWSSTGLMPFQHPCFHGQRNILIYLLWITGFYGVKEFGTVLMYTSKGWSGRPTTSGAPNHSTDQDKWFGFLPKISDCPANKSAPGILDLPKIYARSTRSHIIFNYSPVTASHHLSMPPSLNQTMLH